MKSISPTLVAVFLAGICIGTFATQLLQAVQAFAHSQIELDLSAQDSLAALPVKRSPAVDEAFLSQLRAQNGSVLDGTVLEVESEAK